MQSPYTGRVLEILATPGTPITAGSPIFELEEETDALEAIAYVPAAQGKRIRPKMVAQVSPSTAKREEHGFIVGEARAVSEVPVSRESMMRTLGNEIVVDGLLKAGPVIAVTVALQSSSETPTGFRWSSSKGPPTLLTRGTPCSVQFIVERKRPISLVIPKLREITGVF
jgi:HlyD family secretion protein